MIECVQCQKRFEITKEDKQFYGKLGPVLAGRKYPVSEPRYCPLCREQRRLAIRNERMLYSRKSDLFGKRLISFYSQDKPFKVYSIEEWFSDKWDAMDYGRDFDFSRPFFDQFKELRDAVPRMNTNLWQSENCDYCTFTDFSRNCYLVFEGSNCRDTYYSNLVDGVSDCIDLTGCKKCELCYDCVDCISCNNMTGCINCENSSDLLFCFDCRGCADCMFSFNLNHKKYCIFNKQHSREEYSHKRQELKMASRSAYEIYKAKFLDMCVNSAIHRFSKLVNCESCTGDNLYNCKNAQHCFESNNLRDCKYVQFSMNSRDCYDIIGSSNKGCELVCEAMSVEGQNIFAGYYIAGLNDIYYSDSALACRNVFGCVGIKHKEYCILNKQYSKAQYENLVARIIDHMQKTSEWGEFFPIKNSPFAYNETAAQDYFPITEADAAARGYQWRSIIDKTSKL